MLERTSAVPRPRPQIFGMVDACRFWCTLHFMIIIFCVLVSRLGARTAHYTYTPPGSSQRACDAIVDDNNNENE